MQIGYMTQEEREERREILTRRYFFPKPEEIREAYEFIGSSAKMAANIVRVPMNQFNQWEKGDKPMPYGLFELLLLRTGQKGVRTNGVKGKARPCVWYPPLPKEIIHARRVANLTIEEAADLVHVPPRFWQQWEEGRGNMMSGLFHLFLLKTRQDALVIEGPLAREGRAMSLLG